MQKCEARIVCCPSALYPHFTAGRDKKKKNTYKKGERHVFLILAIRLKELNEIAVLLPFTNFRVIR